MTHFIEPCCADRQLPALLRESQPRAVLFQTAGDVTFDQLLKAVSSMAGNNILTMTLAVPEVTAKMQKTIDHYQQREWITTVNVLTNDLNGQLVMFEGEKGVVIIQGPIIDTRAGKGSLLLYAGQYAPDTKSAPLTALMASRIRLKAKAEEKATVHAASASGEKKSNRKTKKYNDLESTEAVETAPQPKAPAKTTA